MSDNWLLSPAERERRARLRRRRARAWTILAVAMLLAFPAIAEFLVRLFDYAGPALFTGLILMAMFLGRPTR